MKCSLMASTAISLAQFPALSSTFTRPSQRERRSTDLKIKQGIGGLLFGAVLGAFQAAIVPAYADEAQLQRQIDAMKRQLEAMQRELAQTRKQSAQQPAGAAHPHASAAPSQVVTARNGNEIIIPPPAACRSRAYLPGSTAFTSRWPGRLLRSMEHGANTTKCRMARAILPSQIQAFRYTTRRCGTSGSFG